MHLDHVVFAQLREVGLPRVGLCPLVRFISLYYFPPSTEVGRTCCGRVGPTCLLLGFWAVSSEEAGGQSSKDGDAGTS